MRTDILLVEDDLNDVLLIKRAFKKSNIANPLYVVNDGQTAIDYLLGEGEYNNRKMYPLPVLILLDLKLPKKSGFEVLDIIKNSTELKKIPVVVLTSSNQKKDVDLAYTKGVNSYLLKPVEFEQLSELVKTLNMYWLILNELPNKV
ncbi:MAG: response regulator [Bacteroidales bacterium]|jgi:CheY-like chemotaxis protein|nr:response regulator [Bacteroidales bacterium]